MEEILPENSKGYNHNAVGNYNKLFLLDLIRREKGISRKELAKRSNLTTATVTIIVNTLIQDGIVEESQPIQQEKGRPLVGLRLVGERLLSVGFAIDHDYLQGTLINFNGVILSQISISHSRFKSMQDLLKQLSTMYEDLIEVLEKGSAISAIGLAGMGPINSTTGVSSEFLYTKENEHQSLKQLLEEHFNIPVYLENNSTAASIYELWSGTMANEIQNGFYLYMGLGVGGGVIQNRRIYRGSSLNAGEVGHIVVEADGKQCVCGNKGCVEKYISYSALIEDLGEQYREFQYLEKQFINKDKQLMAWLESGASKLSQALGSIVNILDVDTIIMSGIYPKPITLYILEIIKEKMSLFTIGSRPVDPKLVLGEIANQPSLGAAILPFYEGFIPRFSSEMGKYKEFLN